MLDPRDALRARAAAQSHTDRLLRYPNVFGCAVGQRRVKGKPTGEASLVVFVDRKLPSALLRSEDLLPREVPTHEGPVIVDVVERARPYFGIDNAQ